MRLRNKIAMITGATSGIGAVMARCFAEQGAKVVLAARRSDKGNAIVNEILAAGGQAAFCRMDQANEDEVRAAIEFTVKSFGTINILVNNAVDAEATAVEAHVSGARTHCRSGNRR